MSYLLKCGLYVQRQNEIHGYHSSTVEDEMHGRRDLTTTDSSRRSLELLSINIWQI